MSRAKRTDRNQTEIVEALRERKWTVEITSGLAEFVDLVVSPPNSPLAILLEVKDWSKPPSQQRLTPSQEKLHSRWQGKHCFVVNSVAQALDVVKQVYGTGWGI